MHDISTGRKADFNTMYDAETKLRSLRKQKPHLPVNAPQAMVLYYSDDDPNKVVAYLYEFETLYVLLAGRRYAASRKKAKIRSVLRELGINALPYDIFTQEPFGSNNVLVWQWAYGQEGSRA